MRTRKPASVRKAEITRAALELAFEVGPDRVTTAMIADRLGLTQPAIYKHFPNKDDIWNTVTDDLCQRIDTNIHAANGQPEPFNRLRRLIMGQLQLLHDHPALPEIMVMRDPNVDATAIRTRVTTCMGGLRAAIHRAISEAQAVDKIRSDLDAEDCTNLLVGVVQGMALRLLRFREPENFLRTGARLLDLQLKLLTEHGELQ
ncbi:TetR/AcrR family transcriptional regulator [Shimia sediminis]|uniref:TetR/AcrR family transcriptional regulator n=1 Tax=Shimia sediminis TaxID=2497945 RepID=UPI0022A6BFCD|nr:TetR/AcrR family transcriptional regulator [Shimia sediminis]